MNPLVMIFEVVFNFLRVQRLQQKLNTCLIRDVVVLLGINRETNCWFSKGYVSLIFLGAVKFFCKVATTIYTSTRMSCLDFPHS